ncbi:streptogrisin C [Crossiella equi]|uniref:Streptogrisin C n=1 Tax=Crossiella equi TaxID=130796 RepID=A0ABS5AER7_9PSEU|nr:S1 family peptidase [Crossiella equi]MBP2475085.1 streptogrisin C [Crossiella equi]
MKRRSVTNLAVVALIGGGLPLLGALPATASTEVIDAMSRDLGVSTGQAARRLASERLAERIIAGLRERLGQDFAGSWFDAATGTPVVAVTSADRAEQVRRAGARAELRANSLASLDQAKAVLDARTAPAAVTSWYVDEPNNRVVVTTAPGTRAAAEHFAAGARAVQVVESAATPVTTAELGGGTPIYMSGAAGGRCSAGFSARTADGEPRLLTAGHCADGGHLVNAVSGTKIGDFTRINWKDQNDFAEVTVDAANWTLQPVVSTHDGGAVTVKGSTEAAVGASLCKSGSTSKWTCGVVTARNVTVKYGQIDGSTITVRGLVQHNACVEPGDSGGSNVSGDQAQGITSGAKLFDANGDGRNDSCLAKRGEESVSWYQPVNEVLKTYRLTLATG